MKQITNKAIQGKHAKPILIDVTYISNNKLKPVIVFCHGYKGFKDWGAWNVMAKAFALSGFCFVKFNFSHNGGTIHEPIDFPDLEAFGNNNYTKELDDLDAVLNWIETTFSTDANFNISQLTLLGHSRGGGIATIKAAEDKRIKHLISLAGVSDFKKRFPKDEALEQWKRDGVMYVLNGRTKQQMPHYYQFYEDFVQNEKRLTIQRAASNLKIPHLIIHGDKDTSVLPEEAHNLHRWNPNSVLKIIKDADHVFNTKHPWEKAHLSKELKDVMEMCINFFEQS